MVMAGKLAMLPILQSNSVPIPVPVGASMFVTVMSLVAVLEQVAVTSVPLPHVAVLTKVNVVVVVPVVATSYCGVQVLPEMPVPESVEPVPGENVIFTAASPPQIFPGSSICV